MQSLALMVTIIFLTTIFCGPISLLFLYFNFKIISLIFAVLSVVFGVFWLTVAPFPVSLLGILNIICSFIVIRNFLNR
jgi:hypothetical protein